MTMQNPVSSKSRLIDALRNELPVLRARIGLSQETVADKIGISRQTYSSIETGKREMTWTTFMALVAFFQNNNQTAQMLKQMNCFFESIDELLNSKTREESV